MKLDTFLRHRWITALVLLALPAVVRAQFTYTTNDDAITITRYTGPGGAVVIPGMINGYAVTSIASDQQHGELPPYIGVFPPNVTSVTIPNTVTSIGPGAFSDCTSLTSVTIPTTVTSIGAGVFFDCPSLTSITIPNSVSSIGDSAFWNCGLTNIVISSRVTSIGGAAFADCANLTSAYFQGNAPPDLGNAFANDPAAIVYYLPGTTGWGATFGGAPAVEEAASNEFSWVTNSDAVSITITRYTGPGGLVMIPAIVNSLPVTSIGVGAFEDCSSLTSITIPNSVTSIGDWAFLGCSSLASVTIPDSVTNIGTEAFLACGLTSVTIPSSVTSIGGGAFADCTNLTSAYFEGNAPPDNGTVFSDDLLTVYYLSGTTGWGATFGGAPAVEETAPNEFSWVTNSDAVSITITGYTGPGGAVAIPNTINGYAVTGIGDTFYGCTSLTNIDIPASITSIGVNAFANCVSLASVTIPDSVTNIGTGAFGGCGLTSVTIPSSVTSITIDTFIACYSLTNVAIPNSVTNIGADAFRSCTNLTSITIPARVTNIGAIAFADCANLTSAYFLGNAPPDDYGAFADDPAIVYYLPGTSGWAAMFGGVPAVLWNPQAIAFTTAGGQFGFNITGPTNTTIVVEACTNLAHPVWLPVSTITLSGSGTSSFSDPQSMNYPNRYYRFSAP